MNWIFVWSTTVSKVSRNPGRCRILSLYAASSATDLRTGSMWLCVIALLRRCSLPVAHCRNSQLALFFLLLAFMPSDQIHMLVASDPSGPFGPGWKAIFPEAGLAPFTAWK